MKLKELREKIKYQIALHTSDICPSCGEIINQEIFEKLTNGFLSLDGLYTEVEGELPSLPKVYCSELMASEGIAYIAAQLEMLKAGYKKVRPTKELLEEKDE